jgi:hypothetical protein
VFTVALKMTFVEFTCIGFFLRVLRILVGEDQDTLPVKLVIEEISCVGISLIISEITKAMLSIVLY